MKEHEKEDEKLPENNPNKVCQICGCEHPQYGLSHSSQEGRKIVTSSFHHTSVGGEIKIVCWDCKSAKDGVGSGTAGRRQNANPSFNV